MKLRFFRPRRLLAAFGAILAATVGLSGCNAAQSTQPLGDIPMTIKITSSAFENGKPIPKKHTGEGEDVSPQLSWTNVPAETKELALICDDPDAPQPEPWVHWVIYKISATTSSLSEGVASDPRLKDPAGAMQGKNSWPRDNIGYKGPMPPVGHGTHHYHFKLFALKEPLDVEPGLSKTALLQKMKGKILAEGEVIGTYKR